MRRRGRAELAVTLWQRACDGGRAAGCSNAATAHERGEGVAKDASKARDFLERGCTAGGAPACVRLGDDANAGRGVKKDPGKALAYFDRGCELSDGPACEKAARARLAGAGEPPSSNKTNHVCALFDRACSLGVDSVCTMSFKICKYSGP